MRGSCAQRLSDRPRLSVNPVNDRRIAHSLERRHAMPKRATPDGEGKRVPLMARTTIGLRQALEKAAGESGRSLAQEVELRLEKSFQTDQLLDAFIGEDLSSHNVMRAFAASFKFNQLASGKRWVDDYETLWCIKQSLERLSRNLLGMDALPPDQPAGRSDEEHMALLRRGDLIAEGILRDLGLSIPTRTAGLRESAIKAFSEKRTRSEKNLRPSTPKDTQQNPGDGSN